MTVKLFRVRSWRCLLSFHDYEALGYNGLYQWNYVGHRCSRCSHWTVR